MKQKVKHQDIRQEREATEIRNELERASMTFARIATEVDPFYNPRSRIIALEYQDNIYWAYLVSRNEYPDPQLHNLIWIRFSRVDEAPKNQAIPDTFPETMPFSTAFLIPKQEEPHLVEATSTASFTSDYLRDNEERQRVYPGRMHGEAHQRTGLVFNQDSGSVLLKGPNGEISITDKGVHIDGPMISEDMERKGLFEQNPLSFLIPETLVTFPVSMKFLPGTSLLDNVGYMAELLSDVTLILKTIQEI